MSVVLVERDGPVAVVLLNRPEAQGCRILVYGSDPAFLEAHVVHGYLQSGVKIAPKAIEVRYPTNVTELFQGEAAGDPRFSRLPLGREWEVTFYPSRAAGFPAI